MKQYRYRETQKALAARKGDKSLRELARELGLGQSHIAVMSRILRGDEKVSVDAINKLRSALGKGKLIPERVLAKPCPSCGIVHGEGFDCGHHGVRLARVPEPKTGAELVAAIRDFVNDNEWPEGWEPKNVLPNDYQNKRSYTTNGTVVYYAKIC